MQAIISFPDIGPDIFSINLGGFELALRWYAMAYIVGIIIGWRMTLRALKAPRLWPGNTSPMSAEALEDLLTWIILGVIIGGRLGFVLFYQPAYYLSNPVEILMVWQGGMSFHGGFLGVIAAVYFFARKHGIPLLSAGDAIAYAVPPGLLLGRLSNFINGELWGRPTDVPWAVAFPGQAAQTCAGVVGLCGRHPSQIYEAILEGLVLGLVLIFVVWRKDWLKKPGQVIGLFFAGYGVARYFVEFFRQADAQYITPDNPLGRVIGTGVTGLSMGQLLSLPMILIGLALIYYARKRA